MTCHGRTAMLVRLSRTSASLKIGFEDEWSAELEMMVQDLILGIVEEFKTCC